MPKTVSITTEVYCSLQVEGTHCWPTCDITEVQYLKSPHRHIFHIKAYKTVGHDDRDVEFIVLKHDILNFLKETHYDNNQRLYSFGSMSCEQIAKQIISKFNLTRCDVSEDNENGAIVTVNGELVSHENH